MSWVYLTSAHSFSVRAEHSQSRSEDNDGSPHRGAQHKLSLLSHGVYEKLWLILTERACVCQYVGAVAYGMCRISVTQTPAFVLIKLAVIAYENILCVASRACVSMYVCGCTFEQANLCLIRTWNHSQVTLFIWSHLHLGLFPHGRLTKSHRKKKISLSY